LGEQLSNAHEPSQAALERAGQDTYDVIALLPVLTQLLRIACDV